MIRVLNVISDTNIGGAGRVILNYLRYADSSRFETWVAVPKGSLLKEPLEEAGAREVFRERFTGEIFAKNVEQVYLDILKGVSHGTK